MALLFSHCFNRPYCGKSPVTPERRAQDVSTAFKKVADRPGARFAVASNAVETLL